MKKNIYLRIGISVIPIIVVLLAGNFVIKHHSLKEYLSNENTHNLKEIQTKEDRISITYKEGVLDILFLAEGHSFTEFLLLDEEGNMVEYYIKEDGLTYVITDPNFTGIEMVALTYDDIVGFQVTIDGHGWFFTNQYRDGGYYYVNKYGKFDKIEQHRDILPRGINSFASKRGYIWNRTLSSLSNNIIVGSGPDTFILEFPHQDYVDSYNYGFLGSIMTKPHSLYLQIGVQTGLLALFAFMTFYIMYFIQSIRLYVRCKFDNYMKKVGLGLFLGSFAYMITGIANDSVVVVAPVFWCLMGLGLAVNFIIKNEPNI